MQRIQPQTLTNDELCDYTHLIGPEELPLNWVGEIIKRTHNAWKEPSTTVNPQQLELF
jgi:hypothetical protein